MWDLHQHAAAVASLRIGTDRAAMVEIKEDLQTHFDDVMGLAALHIRDKADATGVFFQGGVIEPLGLGQAGVAHDRCFGFERSGKDVGPVLFHACHRHLLSQNYRKTDLRGAVLTFSGLFSVYQEEGCAPICTRSLSGASGLCRRSP